MLERLKDLPEGIEAVKASGTVTKEDYDRVLEPILDAARREGRRIRFLYHFGPDFEGFSASGAWEDARLGLRSMRLFDACAIVSDVGWIRKSSKLVGLLMPCPVGIFGDEEWRQAVDWLQSLPQEEGASHRLIPDAGVIVVDVDKALRARDFEALAATADSWIESHGQLDGIVIHTREFPGWENFGSLLGHIRFVRDHHRKVRRVALASDSKLANLAPQIGDHFVDAEVRRFGYGQLEQAIAWAGRSSHPSAA